MFSMSICWFTEKPLSQPWPCDKDSNLQQSYQIFLEEYPSCQQRDWTLQKGVCYLQQLRLWKAILSDYIVTILFPFFFFSWRYVKVFVSHLVHCSFKDAIFRGSRNRIVDFWLEVTSQQWSPNISYGKSGTLGLVTLLLSLMLLHPSWLVQLHVIRHLL